MRKYFLLSALALLSATNVNAQETIKSRNEFEDGLVDNFSNLVSGIKEYLD